MNEFIHSRLQSFKFAFSGWWYVIQTQKNAWIHAVATLAIILIAIWINLSPRDWVFLIIAIAMVWIAEFLNTALEVVVDLASPQDHPLAKIGKDVGAAAVLIAAIASVAIGGLIILPPFWKKLITLF